VPAMLTERALHDAAGSGGGVTGSEACTCKLVTAPSKAGERPSTHRANHASDINPQNPPAPPPIAHPYWAASIIVCINCLSASNSALFRVHERSGWRRHFTELSSAPCPTTDAFGACRVHRSTCPHQTICDESIKQTTAVNSLASQVAAYY
jgi:hypothetical protein